MELFTISSRTLLLFTLLAVLTLAASSLYFQPAKEYFKIRGPGSVGLAYSPAGNLKTKKDSTPPIYAEPSIDEDVLEEELEREAEEYDEMHGPGSVGLTYRYYENKIDDDTTIQEHGTLLRW